MSETSCWKCGATLVKHGCPTCDKDFVFLAKQAIDRAKDRADTMGDNLSAFSERIKEYRSNPPKAGDIKDIGYAINTLCNIIDLLEQGDSHLISVEDLLEVQEKAQEMITCAQTLLDFKTSDQSGNIG